MLPPMSVYSGQVSSILSRLLLRWLVYLNQIPAGVRKNRNRYGPGGSRVHCEAHALILQALGFRVNIVHLNCRYRNALFEDRLLRKFAVLQPSCRERRNDNSSLLVGRRLLGCVFATTLLLPGTLSVG
jgi:hypothetical protein